MSSKLEPVIWLCDTGHIGIHEGADVRTGDDVMAIKPNFLTSMGYHILLAMVLHARQRRAWSSAMNSPTLKGCGFQT